MSQLPPPTVSYYSRKTLVLWLVLISALWAGVLVFFLVRERDFQARELVAMAQRLHALERQTRALRAEKGELAERAEALRARVEKLASQPARQPPPEPVVAERFFPLGKAIEIVPGRIFLTPVRFEAGRLRLRLASLDGGNKVNRSRILTSGEAWAFEFDGRRYVLLVHSLSQNPPGARLSIRRFGEAKAEPQKQPIKQR